MKYSLGNPKWRQPEDTAGGVLAAMTRETVESFFISRAEDADEPWSALVNRKWESLLSVDEGKSLADEIFGKLQKSEGRKFYAGSEVAVADRPDIYILRSNVEVHVDPSEFDEGAIGDGDNVFQAEDVTGQVHVLRSVADVDRLLRDGVPDGAIGIIDDSGGTLTAPILPDFAGIICLAGTVRSHLGILAREFGVPTLMAARLVRPLENGEHVTVKYSAEPQDVNAYFDEDGHRRAPIYLVSESAES